MTTKEIGDIGERAAARFLKKNKYKIKGRNLHFSHNEIDIVAEDKNYIVFVEVKTRSVDTASIGYIADPPSKAVTKSKQSHLLDAARAYLKEKPSKKQPRMDVIEILIDKETHKVLNLNHIRNAYGV